MSQQPSSDIRRRPRNRKTLIATAAAGLFHRVGYHAARVEEIAAAVGITASAVYRHFPGKQALLEYAVFEGIEHLAEAVKEAVIPNASPRERLDHLICAIARRAVERRDLVAVWQRESRHLTESQRHKLHDRIREVAQQIAEVERAVRHDLSTEDADLLVWAVFGVVGAPSYHHVNVLTRQFETLLSTMSLVVLKISVLPYDAKSSTEADEATPTAPNEPRQAGSRREAILAAAIRLFRERGYQSVSMEDIGTAAGITGPTIYHHFESKAHLLSAALTRATEWLAFTQSQAMAGTVTPEQALARRMAAYAEFAIANGDLLGTYLTERINLPPAERHAHRRAELDNIAEWTRLLAAVHPDLSVSETRIVVHSALGLVTEVARIRRISTRPGLRDILTGLGMDVVLAPVH